MIYHRRVTITLTDQCRTWIECDRYGVSDRLAAALVSAAFKDYDVKEEGQPNKFAGEKKVNRIY